MSDIVSPFTRRPLFCEWSLRNRDDALLRFGGVKLQSEVVTSSETVAPQHRVALVIGTENFATNLSNTTSSPASAPLHNTQRQVPLPKAGLEGHVTSIRMRFRQQSHQRRPMRFPLKIEMLFHLFLQMYPRKSSPPRRLLALALALLMLNLLQISAPLQAYPMRHTLHFILEPAHRVKSNLEPNVSEDMAGTKYTEDVKASVETKKTAETSESALIQPLTESPYFPLRLPLPPARWTPQNLLQI